MPHYGFSKYGSCEAPLLVHYVESTTSILTRLYEEDGKAHNGVPSIQRAVFRYIRTRMIVATVVVSLSVSAAVIGPVSIS